MDLSYFKHYDSEGRIGFTENMIEKKNEILKILPNRYDRNRFNGFLKFINSKKKDLDDFSKVIYFLNSNEVIITCKKHGNYEISPNNYESNHRCSICENNQLTEQEFLNLVNEKFPHIDVLSKFINLNTSIKIKCTNCGKERNVKAHKLLKMKFGCKCFYGGEKLTTKEYKQKLSKNIICLEKYINNSTPILHKCKLCGYEWNLYPTHALKIDCCPKCSLKREGENRKFSLIEVNEKLSKNERPLICLEYTSNHKKSHFKCLKCGYDWWARSGSVIRGGSGCPSCHSSNYETQISDWLTNHNIEFKREYKFNDCKHKVSLPFDFYIPEYNILIEMQGIQHFKPVKFRKTMTTDEMIQNFKLRQKIDGIKKSYAIEKGFKFIEIAYNENIAQKLSNIFNSYA